MKKGRGGRNRLLRGFINVSNVSWLIKNNFFRIFLSLYNIELFLILNMRDSKNQGAKED